MSNKDKVTAILKGFETGDTTALNCINPGKYIQHNLNIPDGLDGLKSLIGRLPATSKLNIARVFQDGNYVFVHTEYHTLRNRIGFDVFRFEYGMIVEHWDNLQEIQQLNPSGHSMIDGETTIKDINKTEANKELAGSFVEEVWIKGDEKKLTDYYEGDNCIQHNPFFPDKVSGYTKALAEWQKQGNFMKYSKIHKVLGEGNFVLVISEGYLKNIHSGFYDLFRIEGGKIAEHWDTVEEIPSKENSKNSNGKF